MRRGKNWACPRFFRTPSSTAHFSPFVYTKCVCVCLYKNTVQKSIHCQSIHCQQKVVVHGVSKDLLAWCLACKLVLLRSQPTEFHVMIRLNVESRFDNFWRTTPAEAMTVALMYHRRCLTSDSGWPDWLDGCATPVERGTQQHLISHRVNVYTADRPPSPPIRSEFLDASTRYQVSS